MCVCVGGWLGVYAKADISPDRSGAFAGRQHFIMRPFGLEQIRVLYRYEEETNYALINTSLYGDHSLWSMMVCVCICVCAAC